ncbi:MAG: response regulator [Chthoniobacterales bacterium]|nr:response regulator [Chthoniobacterales bacterium]
MKKSILVVEDDNDVAELLRGTLRKAGGYSVVIASDGATAIAVARAELPAAIILDVMLPKMSGFEVCRSLKGDARTREIPIVMLTAKGDEVDRITGLELGADDYVTKPFSPREILLRVKVVTGRREPGAATKQEILEGPFVLDWPRHVVTMEGQPMTLTSTEFKLIAAFIENRGRVLGRERLLHEVWGYTTSFNTRTVDTHVRRLREKMGHLGDLIETIRGFGYRLTDSD